MPNRFSGPHDISRCFDEVGTGLYLKEYTTTELYNLFCKIGFSKVNVYIGGKGIYIKFPIFLIIVLEKLLSKLSFALRSNYTTTIQGIVGYSDSWKEID